MIAFKTHREKSAMVQNTRKGRTERIRTYRSAWAIHQNAGQNAYELNDTCDIHLVISRGTLRA